MTSQANHERTAPGKSRIGFTLPKHLVARVDLVVGFRHLADDWVTRVDVVEECLAHFFDAGGMDATVTRPDRVPAGRKIYKMNMDKEMIRAVYVDANAVHTSIERCAPWLVVATAISNHLAECLPDSAEGLTFTKRESIFTYREDSSSPDVSFGRTSPAAGRDVRGGD